MPYTYEQVVLTQNLFINNAITSCASLSFHLTLSDKQTLSQRKDFLIIIIVQKSNYSRLAH